MTSMSLPMREDRQPIVHLTCGLNGAGKSTHAKRLERILPAVRFSLDEWMLRLYPKLHYTTSEYGTQSETCKALIWDVSQQVLHSGVDVILDWNQWSRERRATWRDVARASGYDVRLHYVRTPLDTCLQRAKERAQQETAGSHLLIEKDIRQLAGIFEEPSPTEMIHIVSVE